MKILTFLICILSFQTANAAPIRLQFDRVPIVEFMQSIYTDVLKQNYVLDPKVTTMTETVSIRFESARSADVKSVLRRMLEGMGLQVTTFAGVDFIGFAPPVRQADAEDGWENFIYRPKFRDVRYLTELLASLLKGRFSFQRALQPQQPQTVFASDTSSPEKGGDNTSARALVGQDQYDMFIYTGPKSDIKRLESLLTAVDIAQPEVVVKAYLYEVSGLTRDNSALNIIAALMSKRINISLGQSSQSGNTLSLDIGGLDVLASALSSDRRFKVVSNPSLRVTSGETARLAVGNEVPVLGQFTTNRDGQISQSVQYRSSGAILKIRPVVRAGNLIELNVEQQLSSFANTTSGVNNSPTLFTREVSSRLSSKPGEVVVFAGLKDTKNTDEKTGLGFLPFALGKSKENSESELLLMIEATVL